MKVKLLLVTTVALLAGAAIAQLRITSFNHSGELAWTNSFTRGLYSVESCSALAGPWNTFGSVVDLDWARTNLIRLQVPLTNPPAFYRVAWLPPNPIGVWDYRGYDNQGTLVITGQLNLTSMSLLTSNAPIVYGIEGSWNLQYAGPSTNMFWWLGPQIGTGSLGGSVELHNASLTLSWPTNVRDYNMWLARDLWANTYTGQWLYITFGPVSAGRFTATRMPATNAANLRPAREAGKVSDTLE